MTPLTEGRLTFTFPDDAKAPQIDSWAFYKGPFSRIQGTKAVDFVCVRGFECWLVEVTANLFSGWLTIFAGCCESCGGSRRRGGDCG